jgi:hypothetical protein
MSNIDISEELKEFATSVSMVRNELDRINSTTTFQSLVDLLEFSLANQIIDEDELIREVKSSIEKAKNSASTSIYYRFLLTLVQIHSAISECLQPLEGIELFEVASQMLQNGDYNEINRQLLWDYSYSYYLPQVLHAAREKRVEPIIEMLLKIEKLNPTDKYLLPSIVSRLLDSERCDESLIRHLLTHFGSFPSVMKKITRLYPHILND